jgi:transcriptional regulator with XRE-family HTH domain
MPERHSGSTLESIVMATIEKIRQVQLVGRKIRQLRKENKLTQVELSSRLGIQQSDLSRMEQGEYRVSLDTLFRILAEFKMSIGEFFEGVAQESITPRDVQLVQDFNSLPRDAQREVEDFIAFKRLQTRGVGGPGGENHGMPDDGGAADPRAARARRAQGQIHHDDEAAARGAAGNGGTAGNETLGTLGAGPATRH